MARTALRAYILLASNRRMATVLFGTDDPIGRRLTIINPERLA